MKAQPRALEIRQVYALRAWVGALHSQIGRAQSGLRRQIGEHQREITRLRGAMERSESVLQSLRTSIEELDQILRDVHDTDLIAAAMGSGTSPRQQPPVAHHSSSTSAHSTSAHSTAANMESSNAHSESSSPGYSEAHVLHENSYART